MAGTWIRLASVTASGSSTNLSSGTIEAKKYLMVSCYTDGTTGDTNLTFNNDTGSNYSWRRSINGGSDDTGNSQSNLGNIHFVGSSGVAGYTNFFITNVSDKEKLGVCEGLHQNSAGAGTAPDRTEAVIKWANTSAQITEIDLDSTSANFNTNTVLTVWGASDDVVNDTTNDNSIFEESDTGKHYIWSANNDTWTEIV